MATETFKTEELVSAVVHHAGANPDDFGLDEPTQEQLDAARTRLDASGRGLSSIRDINNDEHVEQDLEDLRSGLLDPVSFAAGYLAQEHPVEYLVHDGDGNLKQRIHSKNLRTNRGGLLQALTMFGDVPANYTALTAAQTTVTGQTGVASGTNHITWTPGTSPVWPTAGNGTSNPYSSLVGKTVLVTAGTGTTATLPVWGTITTNLATAFTVDGWHSIPAGTMSDLGNATALTYTILPFNAPALYMALSNDTNASEADITGSAAAGAANGFTTATALTVSGSTASSTTGGEYSDATNTGLNRTLVATTAAANGTSNASPTWYSPNAVAGASPSFGSGVTNQIPGIAGTGTTYTATQQGGLQLVVKFSPTGGGGTVGKSALFNTGRYAGGGATGDPLFVATLGTVAALNAGDTLTVTWQIMF